MRILRESALFAPVSDWLRGRGMRVFGEYCGHDVMAHNDSTVVCVELKTGFTKGLLLQAMMAGTRVHEAWAAAPTVPSLGFIWQCYRHQVGVLRVNGAVQIVKPAGESRFANLAARTLADLLALPDPDPAAQVGGIPCLAGNGPAQECQRRIDAYRAKHPKATWAELYAAVPNHYVSAKRMGGAMRSNAERLAWRRQRDAATDAAKE